jgi:hypothetical protein
VIIGDAYIAERAQLKFITSDMQNIISVKNRSIGWYQFVDPVTKHNTTKKSIMDISKTIQILEALVSGCSPKTGEIVAEDSVLNERDVIRALQITINELKTLAPKDIQTASKKDKVDKNIHKEIDYFKKEKFNHLSSETIDKLKSRVRDFGVTKTESLSDYIINARTNYKRAYEPWSDDEKELFAEAIKYTNDVDLLSECFQRGKGSIESFGQKLIYEFQNA